MAVLPAPSPSPTGPSSGGSGASSSLSGILTYARMRTLSGGTYTPATDWAGQFDDASETLCALPTMEGQFRSDALTSGICVDYAFWAYNAFDATIWIEASVGIPLQIQVNGISTEYTASQLVTISALPNFNTVKFIRAAGPMIVNALLFGNKMSRWVSLYPVDSDPLVSSSSGASSSKAGVPPPSIKGVLL